MLDCGRGPRKKILQSQALWYEPGSGDIRIAIEYMLTHHHPRQTTVIVSANPVKLFVHVGGQGPTQIDR